ncbi:MAG: gfo/Idh/MocA family oxidoreductase [Planctomycetes bacterium]|nr:gfo/Idh/MocA family oxidoreductase [Planctomycetota bacterium]
MKLAIVGCGYVANMYRLTLPLHPQLTLVGVFDRDADRSRKMAELCGCEDYASFDKLLADERVELVLNLTNPSSHYAVTRACLEAGKHVYTEKPLAMDLGEARQLVELAKARGLALSSAPCTLLNEAAQTLWKALRERQVGDVKLAYAEMDDGMTHLMPYQRWINEAGVAWPAVDEFATGCTVEHAGYVLTWLCAYFGPAKSVTAFSSRLYPDKVAGESPDNSAPDFSVGCIQFVSGVVARLTCGIVAPRNHTMTIVGDEGVLSVDDPRSDRSPVRVQKYLRIRRKMLLNPWRRRYPMVGLHHKQVKYRGSQRRDFCRGIAEMAEAIAQHREPRLNALFCLHVNELTLQLNNAMENAGTYQMTTTFDPVEPMPWAQSPAEAGAAR